MAGNEPVAAVMVLEPGAGQRGSMAAPCPPAQLLGEVTNLFSAR